MEVARRALLKHILDTANAQPETIEVHPSEMGYARKYESCGRFEFVSIYRIAHPMTTQHAGIQVELGEGEVRMRTAGAVFSVVRVEDL